MSNQDGSDSNPTLLIGIGVAALIVIGGWWWMGSDDDKASTLKTNVGSQKFARPLNLPKGLQVPPRERPSTVPVRLSPALQKRLGAPRKLSPLVPARDDKANAADATSDTGNAAPADAVDDDKLNPEAKDRKNKPRGSLSKESIQAGVRAIKPQIVSCFEEGLKHNPSLAGRVLVSFEIEADDDGNGKVVSGEVKDSEVQSPFFEACVLKQIGGQTFDAPEGGGSVSVTYPFNFDPGGGFGAAPPGESNADDDGNAE